jgi:hypothetical protein
VIERQLPFTPEQFLDLFGDYNRSLWPVVVVAWAATLLALLHFFRRRLSSGRLIAWLLAFHWAWSGLVYHLVFFHRINPAAVLFGAAFLLEALCFAWQARSRTPLAVGIASVFWRRIGTGMVLYAMIYPVLGLLFGLEYPRFPSFGVPCPTTILTAGLLVTSTRSQIRLLGMIPVMWAAVGSFAALAFGIQADYALPLTGLLLVIRMIVPDARRSESTTEQALAHGRDSAR